MTPPHESSPGRDGGPRRHFAQRAPIRRAAPALEGMRTSDSEPAAAIPCGFLNGRASCEDGGRSSAGCNKARGGRLRKITPNNAWVRYPMKHFHSPCCASRYRAPMENRGCKSYCFAQDRAEEMTTATSCGAVYGCPRAPARGYALDQPSGGRRPLDACWRCCRDSACPRQKRREKAVRAAQTTTSGGGARARPAANRGRASSAREARVLPSSH